jgi:hypothetical protein
MQEVLPGLPDTLTEQRQIKLNAVRDRRTASLLKFYIHDSAAYFRLELIGELTEVDIAELAGCWRTAKSSISGRTLALDVRNLKAVDEDGRQWLSLMVREGACYITGKNRSGAYLTCPEWRPGDSDSDPDNCGPKVLHALLRILSFMRQCIAGVDARSQTNTVNADSVRVTGL